MVQRPDIEIAMDHLKKAKVAMRRAHIAMDSTASLLAKCDVDSALRAVEKIAPEKPFDHPAFAATKLTWALDKWGYHNAKYKPLGMPDYWTETISLRKTSWNTWVVDRPTRVAGTPERGWRTRKAAATAAIRKIESED